MRGRTIYYQNRRILVFCGEKRNTPHSANDVFSTAAETARTGENAETFVTDTNDFAESESGGAIGSDDDTFITSSERTTSENGLFLSHIAQGTVYADVYAMANDELSLVNNTKATNTETRLGNSENGIITGKTAQAVKTMVKLSESVEDIATGNQSEAIKTEQHERAEAESGISAQQENTANNTNALLTEAESAIAAGQNVEPYVEQPTRTISAGRYASRTDITTVEAVYIDIPLSYIDETETQVTAASMEVKKYYIFGTLAWLLDADSSVLGNYYNNQWLLLLGEGETTFTVLQDTTVTLTQYNLFFRYFELKSYL